MSANFKYTTSAPPGVIDDDAKTWLREKVAPALRADERERWRSLHVSAALLSALVTVVILEYPSGRSHIAAALAGALLTLGIGHLQDWRLVRRSAEKAEAGIMPEEITTEVAIPSKGANP